MSQRGGKKEITRTTTQLLDQLQLDLGGPQDGGSEWKCPSCGYFNLVELTECTICYYAKETVVSTAGIAAIDVNEEADLRPVCPMGSGCTATNPDHFMELRHTDQRPPEDPLDDSFDDIISSMQQSSHIIGPGGGTSQWSGTVRELLIPQVVETADAQDVDLSSMPGKDGASLPDLPERDRSSMLIDPDQLKKIFRPGSSSPSSGPVVRSAGADLISAASHGMDKPRPSVSAQNRRPSSTVPRVDDETPRLERLRRAKELLSSSESLGGGGGGGGGGKDSNATPPSSSESKQTGLHEDPPSQSPMEVLDEQIDALGESFKHTGSMAPKGRVAERAKAFLQMEQQNARPIHPPPAHQVFRDSPSVPSDAKALSPAEHLRAGIKCAKMGGTLDQRKDYHKALSHYEDACFHFEMALSDDQKPAVRSLLLEKKSAYQKRISEINRIIVESSPPVSGVPAGRPPPPTMKGADFQLYMASTNGMQPLPAGLVPQGVALFTKSAETGEFFLYSSPSVSPTPVVVGTTASGKLVSIPASTVVGSTIIAPSTPTAKTTKTPSDGKKKKKPSSSKLGLYRIPAPKVAELGKVPQDSAKTWKKILKMEPSKLIFAYHTFCLKSGRVEKGGLYVGKESCIFFTPKAKSGKPAKIQVSYSDVRQVTVGKRAPTAKEGCKPAKAKEDVKRCDAVMLYTSKSEYIAFTKFKDRQVFSEVLSLLYHQKKHAKRMAKSSQKET